MKNQNTNTMERLDSQSVDVADYDISDLVSAAKADFAEMNKKDKVDTPLWHALVFFTNHAMHAINSLVEMEIWLVSEGIVCDVEGEHYNNEILCPYLGCSADVLFAAVGWYRNNVPLHNSAEFNRLYWKLEELVADEQYHEFV